MISYQASLLRKLLKIKHLASLLVLISVNTFSQFDPATVLWYNVPAETWEEALPVGNGRLGAMYYGDVYSDKLQFNEDTYWTGGPYSTVVKGGYEKLPEIQQLLFEGRVVEAHQLFGRYLLGNPVEQQKYQSMGNVVLEFENKSEVSDYRRELDLNTGITRITYKQDGVQYSREVFASCPGQAVIMKISSDKAGSISFSCQLQGVRNQTHSNYATDYFMMDLWGDDGLKLQGKSADYMGVEGKLRYEARLKAINEGGEVNTSVKSMHVKNADEVILILVAATNFNSYKDVTGDCTARVRDYLARIEGKDYERMKKEHIADHQSLFNRVSLKLPTGKNSYEATNERMELIQDEPDPALAALCYQFGRYIMIGSSRPGTQPANLQGIWNTYQNPSWDSKYTTNINTEMNYWIVDAGNLSECASPLFDLIREVSDQGSEVAKEHYGIDKGWVFHQNTDLWRVAAPMDGSNWGAFTTGGAWLCTHIWEHYLSTGDEEFLKQNYDLLKGSAEFFLEYLVKHPKTEYLVTNPSTSPENYYVSPGNYRFFDEMNGNYYKGSQLCFGSTIDTQILMDLFDYVSKASEVLGIDDEFRSRVINTRKRLNPMQAGKDGSLQEWSEDWDEMDKHHRHFSHLYGLYPGNVISPVKTPELVEPVINVLEKRGDGATGWSRAWKMCTWARLYDGNRANKIFKGYLKEQCYPSLFGICGTALQVDATFGVSAAVTEMLIQSNEGYLNLLPAISDTWKSEGSFSGVVTRGAFELDYSWTGGKVQTIKLLSKAGNECKIKCEKKPAITTQKRRVKVTAIGNGIYAFPTISGRVYYITMN